MENKKLLMIKHLRNCALPLSHKLKPVTEHALHQKQTKKSFLKSMNFQMRLRYLIGDLCSLWKFGIVFSSTLVSKYAFLIRKKVADNKTKPFFLWEIGFKKMKKILISFMTSSPNDEFNICYEICHHQFLRIFELYVVRKHENHVQI